MDAYQRNFRWRWKAVAILTVLAAIYLLLREALK